MVDSLKTRVSRVIAGSVNALIDRIEDQAPEAVMEQAIRETGKVIDDVRAELGQVIANHHLTKQQHAKQSKQHTELAEQIQVALDQQREDLATAAVSRQLDIEAQLPVLESTLAEQTNKEGELQGYVVALQAKQREMAEALEAFRKSRAASAVEQGGSIAAGTGSAERRVDQATSAFDRVHARQTGLSSGARGATLQQGAQLQELDELVRSNKVAERLAQLKASKAGASGEGQA